MAQRVVHTEGAPGALGPYSQAIEAGDWVFTAGQIGLDPESGELEESIESQTTRALENIRAVLEAAGCGMDRIVKTTVFLRDMADFAAFNAVYAEMVADPPPARSTVQVAGLPKSALVEIEAVAYRGT
ncbi:MAG: RidA family protein [Gemmatimonadota bacterium]